jgi:hypothetical protein
MKQHLDKVMTAKMIHKHISKLVLISTIMSSKKWQNKTENWGPNEYYIIQLFSIKHCITYLNNTDGKLLSFENVLFLS